MNEKELKYANNLSCFIRAISAKIESYKKIASSLQSDLPLDISLEADESMLIISKWPAQPQEEIVDDEDSQLNSLQVFARQCILSAIEQIIARMEEMERDAMKKFTLL